MRKIWFLLLMMVVFISCSKKNKEGKASEGWKELESFHKVMAAVYHPMKDSGNLVPARKLMNQLADEADKWSASTLPEKVNEPEVKERLQKLKTDARTLADEIAKGATDESIKENLTHLHSEFHEIMEAWFNSEGDDKDEDEDDH